MIAADVFFAAMMCGFFVGLLVGIALEHGRLTQLAGSPAPEEGR